MTSAHSDIIADRLDSDPYATCLVGSRFLREMSSARMGGEFWGITGGRDGIFFAGSNLIPVSGDAKAMRAFASLAMRRGRRSASLMGRSELVTTVWEALEPKWGPARAIRWNQPVLTCVQPPAVPPDARVGRANPHDLDLYYPAAVAMFTAEIGIDPRQGDGGRSYSAKLRDLLSRGHCFARIEDGRVIFKAEIGAMTATTALIQGVWVDPEWRGRGIGAAGMAAVVAAIQQGLGKVPCLYVNDFNSAARAAYSRVGFTQVASFTSVLF
ncbi:DUF4081 domain-containing GNAT family N-acetyltransferase [Nakamurella antarctica]|uniref:GNAT family N-acetyltransferase n=1 Tax=Nakamurella antarctica TaxID=1902245 RepID=UPI001EF0DBA6|nr:DUF4081 domain-containing GNAT family N-acetyltransferase [Nakamurella antarctica]